MSEPLHPLTLSEVLDRTAQMLRARFLVYLGIGVVPAGTLLVFGGLTLLLFGWMRITTVDASSSGAQAVVGVVLMCLLGLIALPAYVGASALGWAALNDAASRSFLGEAITIRGSFGNVWRRGWRYVGLYLLIALCAAIGPFAVLFVGLLAIAALSAAAGLSGGGNVLVGMATFTLVPVLFGFAVWMLLRLALAFPACVVEGIGPVDAMRRGTALSKGTRGRMILLFLLGWAANMLLMIALMIPIVLVLTLLPAASAAQHAERVGQIFIFVWYGLSFAVQAVVRPIYGIGLTLFYFDQRIRKEGFDIEWMMRGAGMAALPVPPPEATPWLPPVETRGPQQADPPARDTAAAPEIPPPASDPV